MSSKIIRCALTETKNAYAPMPDSTAGLETLAGHLDEVRRQNLEHHAELIAIAAGAGAKVIGLGELFGSPYFALEQNALWLDVAEEAESGPTATFMSEVAKKHEIIIVAPIYEIDRLRGIRFNTAIVIDERGDVLGKYRKSHIPRGANELGTFQETYYYQRADGRLRHPAADAHDHPYFPVFRTRIGQIGVAICYDRHFEGVMSTLARGGAQIIFSPAVTFGQKSALMWRQEFAVDAVRHRVFIGGSNRRGLEPPWNIDYFGDSHFVGPEGPLENLSGDPRLVIADLDLEVLSSDDPSGWNFVRDARDDIFDG